MSKQLRNAFGHCATGVTIITTMGEDARPIGMTANSFTSLSLEPPLVLWSIALASSNYAAFRAARAFAVHVLRAEQAELAKVFATKDIDRFANVRCASGATGAPILPDYHACFDCTTETQYTAGDHLIIIGRVQQFDERAGAPLVFYRGRFAILPQQG
jgi:flavin reductase (DIM6/NTAB) family NADH-FMN oxidoreductase RutF